MQHQQYMGAGRQAYAPGAGAGSTTGVQTKLNPYGQTMGNPASMFYSDLDRQQQSTPQAQQQQQQAALLGQQGLGQGLQGSAVDKETVYPLVLDLMNPETREEALLELSKRREVVPELAPILWHSYGVMSTLLQEIVCIYPLLSPPTLSSHQSNRVCNALALLQCVASHNDTRSLFLNAHLPLFLYPFLATVSKARPFEYLRLTSLGVIGALVKNDSTEVVHFLLTSEIIPLCLRIMETGSELSKTVAIFIVQKILLDEMGLNFVCQTYERFLAVVTVFNTMVGQLVEHQALRLLKHVIRCYHRLSDNARYAQICVAGWMHQPTDTSDHV